MRERARKFLNKVHHERVDAAAITGSYDFNSAAHRLPRDAGRRGIAEWERQHNALTAGELADGLAPAGAILRRTAPSRKSAC